MMKSEDFLVEIHTEELPPKALLKLGEAFRQQIAERLQKADLKYADIKFYATPRRLAVLVHQLVSAQPDQVVERKGPALSAAFDAQGNPSPACIGFARSVGVTPAELKTIKTNQGEWVGYSQNVPGKPVTELLPAMVEQAATALPIPKRMRWGDNDAQFSRPIHSVIMLYGENIVPGTILGYPAGRKTRGHRFHAPQWLEIPRASDYVTLLEKEGHVIADVEQRRTMIREQTDKILSSGMKCLIIDDLLDEVTGLVEWPVALLGKFDDVFLDLPPEVLISSMQDHQRYFPVADAKNKLMPHFVTISNIESRDAKRVIHGNERVIRARLSDAAFFYAADKKEALGARVERLKGIVFQAKLGTLYDKAERISKIGAYIAEKLHVNTENVKRAGLLAKTDLTTNMVNEFPELQGVIGSYYARHDKEHADVAQAMQEQYMPRFAGDNLPQNPVGQVLALADRIDTLVGTFGINQIPTGDKDPYGSRRAALGVLRTLIENNISLDLDKVLEFAVSTYTVKLENAEVVPQVLNFLQERLRAFYQEQGITADVFAAVAALGITNPLDAHQRILAVQAFKKLSEAESLSVANKRVSNILAKYVEAIEAKAVDPSKFENSAENELAQRLEEKSIVVSRLSDSGKYEEVLFELAGLRKPVDDFFDQVMVMTEDKPRRENRLLLLSKLRSLFLRVADIALLQ